MWYPATITSPAESTPVTLTDVKAQARISFSDDDAYLETLIAAAVDHVERYCNICLATQTVSVQCDSFDDLARLPAAPVKSVVSITYIDPTGAQQTLPDTVYNLRASGLEAAITLQNDQYWPPTQHGSPITVTTIVGYDDAPAAIRYAMMLYVAGAYEQREIAELGGSQRLAPGALWIAGWTSFDSLLANFRRGA